MKEYPNHLSDFLHLSGIYLAQKMSPDKRAEFVEAVENIGDRDEKSVSPSPSNTSEGENSP